MIKINTTLKVIIVLFLVLAGAVAYYALSPLWQTVTVIEDAPINSTIVVSNRPIIDTPTHPASGSVAIVQTGEQRTLRYEDFQTINGPDLRVYLSIDLEATEFIDLGELKATEGDVNYAIPDDTDLAKYQYALIWCEDFSVLFNHAQINP